MVRATCVQPACICRKGEKRLYPAFKDQLYNGCMSHKIICLFTAFVVLFPSAMLIYYWCLLSWKKKVLITVLFFCPQI